MHAEEVLVKLNASLRSWHLTMAAMMWHWSTCNELKHDSKFTKLLVLKKGPFSIKIYAYQKKSEND